MQNIISDLNQILQGYPTKFNFISEYEFNSKPTPEKWSRKEVLGHLVDSAQNNLRRFIVGQYQQNDKIFYDQNFWNAANNYQFESRQDIITLWVLLNKRICAVLNNIPVEKYENIIDTGRDSISPKTIIWLAEDYVKHMKHHINQIIPGSFDLVYS
ncbi:MAG: DinB family protein [Bacteroidetes bacterium]|nr:DinB family protein [Bacteroidota bacterium]